MAYYNDNDRGVSSWLIELVNQGHLPAGTVDRRSIARVKGRDLEGHRHCHFFAGIGNWALALRWAGWPDEWEVWTGSCPCTPFSIAGRRGGFDDKRHLWPVWRDLIAERRPATLFGEQVASKDGRDWLSRVRSDLETLGYAVGASDLCVSGAGEDGEGWIVRGDTGQWESVRLGPPHIRQRLFFVAYHRMANPQPPARTGRSPNESGESPGTAGERTPDQPGRRGLPGGMANTRFQQRGEIRPAPGSNQSLPDIHNQRCGQDGGSWSDFDIILCADGKARRIESGTEPLAHGEPARVGRLRGYGNAICPQIAAIFVEEAMKAGIELGYLPRVSR
jgi:DNA (cytosine-5)-methyltransferase 1